MKQPVGKTNLFFINLTIFINLIGFGMVFPLLPYYAQQYNASELQIGLLAASFALAQFLFAPIWGRISDKYGRKPIITTALIGNVVAFSVFGIAHNLEWLFISRFLQGVFSAAALPVAQAYVADVTSKEERIKGMGNLGGSLALGFIFGPAIGGLLSQIDVAFPFFAAATVAFINLILVRMFLPESIKQKAGKLVIGEGFLNIKKMYFGLKGELGSLFILIFLWSFALSNNQVAVPLFGYQHLNLDTITVGIFFSLMGLISGFIQFKGIHKISGLVGEHRSAVLGLSLMAVGLFLMPFSVSGWMMGALMMLIAGGSGMARPTLTTMISKNTQEGQGTTMGISTAFESFGRMLGPLLGGWLFYTFGFQLPFIFGSAVLIVTLLYVIKYQGFLKSK